MFRHLAQWAGYVARAYQRRKAIEELSRFSDRQLADLGIERGEIADLVSGLEAPRPERGRVPARAAGLSLQVCG